MDDLRTAGLRERLIDARQRAGLSARALSLAAGASHGALAHFEAGRVEAPDTEFLVSIAGVLHVSLDWLLCGTGEVPDDAALHAAGQAAAAKGAA